MGKLSFTTSDGEVHSLGKAYRGGFESFRGIWKDTLNEAIKLSQMSGKDVFYCLKWFGANGIYYEYRFFCIPITDADIEHINRRFSQEYNIEIVRYDRVKDMDI